MADEGKGLRQGITCRLGVRGIGVAAATELGGQGLGLSVHQFEVHGGIVQTGGLVDIDIQAVGTLHLQGGLYACG